jgi:hypothetical protein
MFDDKQKYLRELISKIKRLTVKEKHHILSIFKKYNVEYTKNSNGYFFNLDKINNNILDKVFKCVDLIEEKRELITTLDKKRDTYLEYYKNLIENKLKETINKKKQDYIKQLILIPSNISIKKKFVKKVARFSNLDPDVLMKEHNKSKKYNKSSVFYRINQRIVEISRKYRRISNKSTRDDDDDYPNVNSEKGDAGEGTNIDLDIDDGDLDDVDDNGGMVGLDDELQDIIGEEYLDETNDGKDTSSIDDYGYYSEVMDENEYYKDVNNSETESNIEYKTDKSDKSEKTDKTENKTKTTKTDKMKRKKMVDKEANSHEIDYYKSLLKQSGFKFDDDKCVQIMVEEYIE